MNMTETHTQNSFILFLEEMECLCKEMEDVKKKRNRNVRSEEYNKK